MRVVFMGSPEFAVPTLRAVAAAHELVLAVCQPDKPAGRGRKLTPPAIKVAAEAAGIRVVQPRTARSGELEAELRAVAADVAVVVAYGKILPQAVLDVPRLGCLNVHASLLPRWRGAAPIQWAIIHGERETGVTIMQLDAGMDTGPMLVSEALPIGDEETAGTLAPKLSELGARLMVDVLARIERGEPPPPRAQDDAQATMAPMLDKRVGVVDWGRTAREVSCLIRGVDPWPGAQTGVPGAPGSANAGGVEVLKLWRPRPAPGRGEPGTVLGLDGDGLVVACSDEALAIGELQLPGRKRMPAQALCAGRPIPPGTRLVAPPEPPGQGDADADAK